MPSRIDRNLADSPPPPPPMPPPSPTGVVSVVEHSLGENDSVFAVLARQARGRTRFELSITAVGCSLNSVVLWRHPALGWLASGFAAAAAYGVWGLADHALHALPPEGGRPARVGLLSGVRALALAGGLASAVAAVLGFVAAMLSNWMH